jgi:hypothetical protein
MYCTDKDYGEEYTAREVGKKGVVSIHEHLPLYASDPYYCRVKFNDGHQERVMNINSVITDSNGF